jgi:hypothetical protein
MLQVAIAVVVIAGAEAVRVRRQPAMQHPD